MMDKDPESWLHHGQLDEQFSNVKSSKLPFNDVGMRNSLFPCAIPCTNAAPTNAALLAFGSSRLPNIKSGQLKEPHGWFYCLPRSRQGLIPDMTMHNKSLSKTNLLPKENFREAYSPNIDVACASKQFLVFDQTGNKTTMMFSSGINTSIPRPTAWSLKPTSFENFKENISGPNLTDDLDDDHGSDDGSNMRENSDEIDALLYSDEDDDNSEDEQTSTGHSPSTMTAYEKQDLFDEEDTDEVASSIGPIKRQKLSENDHQVPSVTYTMSHVKRNRSSEYVDDAESSCAGGTPMKFTHVGLLPGNKRMRRENIRETVRILQTILPVGKGKDAVMVLDEAIDYLKALKLKAESLVLSGCSE